MENVEGYEKKSVVSKKVWIKKSNWNDEVSTYVENEVIKQKFRDYLVNFYRNKKDRLLKSIYLASMKNDFQEEVHDSKVKYNEELLIVEKDIELLSKMLFESVLFKNIMKMCEFFFEYNNEIIEKWSSNGVNFYTNSHSICPLRGQK